MGTESDLLGVRALRGDVLYLYPSKASPDQAREMLADMLRRAQALHTEPEFYNTVTNNCATNLREHVNRIAAEPLPFGWGILFPGYSDELARARGLLATDLSLEAARTRYRRTSVPRLRWLRERRISRPGFGGAPERSRIFRDWSQVSASVVPGKAFSIRGRIVSP